MAPFSSPGCASGAVTRENVVAWKLGAGHPGRLIVLGGHYDSRTLDATDGTSPAPGANDSGSQTALVLEAARVMSSQTYDATLVFVSFAGEEQGLFGSSSLAASYGQYFPAGASIEAMFNCDIVGGDATVNDAGTLQEFRLYSPGTPREISSAAIGTTDDTSPARGVMRFVATVGGAYVPSMTMVPELREDRPLRSGDHESFLDVAIPGVRFIETVESPDAGTLGSHQHSPNDLRQYVTPAYTARIAQVVVASVASLARAPSPPLSIAASGAAPGRSRSRGPRPPRDPPWITTWSRRARRRRTSIMRASSCRAVRGRRRRPCRPRSSASVELPRSSSRSRPSTPTATSRSSRIPSTDATQRAVSSCQPGPT